MDKETRSELKKLRLAMHPLSMRFGSLWNIFVLGMIQGVGVVVGATVLVLIVSWFVSFLGLIPGLEHIATTIQNLLDYAAEHR